MKLMHKFSQKQRRKWTIYHSDNNNKIIPMFLVCKLNCNAVASSLILHIFRNKASAVNTYMIASFYSDHEKPKREEKNKKKMPAFQIWNRRWEQMKLRNKITFPISHLTNPPNKLRQALPEPCLYTNKQIMIYHHQILLELSDPWYAEKLGRLNKDDQNLQKDISTYTEEHKTYYKLSHFVKQLNS